MRKPGLNVFLRTRAAREAYRQLIESISRYDSFANFFRDATERCLDIPDGWVVKTPEDHHCSCDSTVVFINETHQVVLKYSRWFNFEGFMRSEYSIPTRRLSIDLPGDSMYCIVFNENLFWTIQPLAVVDDVSMDEQRAFESITDYKMYDVHEYNLGFYRGRLVQIDS